MTHAIDAESHQLDGDEGCSSSSIQMTFYSGLSDGRDCESLDNRGATTGKSPLRLLDPSDSGTLEAVIAGELHMGGRPDPLVIQEDESDLSSVEETSENEAESADIDYYSLGGTHEEHLDELASAYSDAQSTLDDDNDDEQVATEEEGNEQWPTIRDEEASEEELECDEDEIYDLSSRDQFEENEESQDSSPSSGEESDPDSDDDYTSNSSSVEEVEADESLELEQEARRQVVSLGLSRCTDFNSQFRALVPFHSPTRRIQVKKKKKLLKMAKPPLTRKKKTHSMGQVSWL